LAFWKWAAASTHQWAMARNSSGQKRGPQRQVRRWAREVVLAVLLTLAAATFILAALLRGSPDVSPSFETARKQPGN
jgi:hypothetical protein